MHRAGQEVETYDTMEAKIIKYHARSRRLAKFGEYVCYLQDQTELLDGYSLKNTTKNSSINWFHSVHQSAPFYLTWLNF